MASNAPSEVPLVITRAEADEAAAVAFVPVWDLHVDHWARGGQTPTENVRDMLRQVFVAGFLNGISYSDGRLRRFEALQNPEGHG